MAGQRRDARTENRDFSGIDVLRAAPPRQEETKPFAVRCLHSYGRSRAPRYRRSARLSRCSLVFPLKRAIAGRVTPR